MTAVKIIRVRETSSESWEGAEEAYREASQTVEDSRGMAVVSWSANTGGGSVTECKTTVELTVPVRQQ